jgi:hypothetical protein
MGQEPPATGHELYPVKRGGGRLLSPRSALLALAVLGSALAAHAQTTDARPAPTSTAAEPAPTANGAAQAGGYVDREIEGLTPLDTGSGETTPYNTEGLPRFLRLETRLGTQPFELERKTRLGFAAFGLLETPNHGALSLDGSYTPSTSRGTLTLRQRGLPWAGGWLANHEAGVINTLAPDITRRPSRVFVPSSILQGASAEWENAGHGLQLQAATGQPGRLEGLPTNGFRALAGRRTGLAAQWYAGDSDNDTNNGLAARPGWTVALRAEQADGVSSLDNPTLATDFVDARSTQLALRHESSAGYVQAQAVNTAASNVAGSRQGFWVDSEWNDGPRKHGAGLFRLESDLSWAQQPLASDIAGAYLRTSWRTRQWSAEATIDWLQSISGRTANGNFATANARWRMGQGSSLGAGTSLRRFDGNAWSAYTDWRSPNGWGTGGLRLELSGGDTQASRQQVSYDQDWTVPQGYSLSTSLGAAKLGADAASTQPEKTLWNAATSLSAPLGSRSTLRGNLNTEHGSDGSRRWGVNLSADWRINPRWSLEANFNRSTGQTTSTPLDPLATPLPTVNTSSDRSFYAVLRYELQAGSRDSPLGGRALEGGGRVEGVVYFDDNKSGTQEASEQGVPNVTVFLDNRYGVRTDAQGRFEFPFVATGARTVSVRSDTLPLPWASVGEGQSRVDVRLRDTTRLSIPVQRLN